MPKSIYMTSNLSCKIFDDVAMATLSKGVVFNKFNSKITNVATETTEEVLIKSSKEYLSDIRSGLGRVLIGESNPEGQCEIRSVLRRNSTRTISSQSNLRGQTESDLGKATLKASSTRSNPKGPTEICSCLCEFPPCVIPGQLNQKGITEIRSDLGEVATRAFSTQSKPTEMRCILGRNQFHKSCKMASKGPFFRMAMLGTAMFCQARAISIVPQRAFAAQSNLPTEYQMPTVTWGAVVQGDKEKIASRAKILDYLKRLGIVPDGIEEVELPSTIDVMKERVEFLQRIGLSIKDINDYPLMLGCSVRKNLIPVLEFMYTFGIEKEDLPFFIRKYPQLLHASVVVELVPIIKYLRGLDIEKTDIPIVLKKYPELLGFKLEGTMSTSVAYLINIGVNPRDVGPMLTEYPQILGMRVGTIIKPFVDYLLSLGIPKQAIARMIEKRPHILGYDLEEIIKPNVNHLLSFGVRQEALASVIAQYPEILGLCLKRKLESRQQFFKSTVKVSPENFGSLLEKMPQVVILNHPQILRAIYFLRGRGFTVEDVAKMIVACPQLLVLDVESLKLSFYYYKTEIKRPLLELVEFPEYFTYSLEWRIRPRFRQISSQSIKCSLAWFLNCSDRSFKERIEDNDIKVEGTGPIFSMGGALQLPRDENDLANDGEDSEEEMLYITSTSVAKR